MSDETVSVAINFDLNGQDQVDRYTDALKKLDSLEANGLTAYEVAVKRVEAATKAGQKVTETYTAKVKDAQEQQAKVAEVVRKAEIDSQKYANTVRKLGQEQFKLAASAQEIANRQVRAEQAALKLAAAQRKLDASLSDTGSQAKKTGSILQSVFSGAALGSLAGGLAGSALGALGSLLKSLPAEIVGVGKTFFDLAKSASDFGSSIFDASQKVSLSAETLSTIKVAADISGSSLESFTSGFTKFERGLASAAAGNEKLAKTFRALGIDIKEGVSNPEAALAQFLEKFNQLPEGANRAAIAMAVFGKGGAELIPTFLELGGNLEEAKKKAEALGLTIDSETAAAADKFGDTLDTVSKQVKGLGYTVGNQFLPLFQDVMDEVSGALTDNKSNIKDWASSAVDFFYGVGVEIQQLGDDIRSVFDGIDRILGYFGTSLDQAFEKLKKYNSALPTFLQNPVIGSIQIAEDLAAQGKAVRTKRDAERYDQRERDRAIAENEDTAVGYRRKGIADYGLGGSDKKAEQPNLEPIDALARASSEARRKVAEAGRKIEKANNDLELKDLEFHYKQRNLTVTAYYDGVRVIREKNLDLELAQNAAQTAKLNEAADRAIGKLNDSRLPAQDKDGRTRDALKAELAQIAAEKEAVAKERAQLELQKQNVAPETSREELAALQQLQTEYNATARSVAELTQNQKILAALDKANNFDEPLRQAQNTLNAAEEKVRQAQAAGDKEAEQRFAQLAKDTEQQIQNLLIMQRQVDLNDSLAKQQKAIAEIEARRTVALDDLNKQIAESGISSEEADKQRNALMLEYQTYINNVLATLKLIREQAVGKGLFTGGLDAAIGQGESNRKQVETTKYDPKDLNAARRLFDSSLAERDQRLTDAENSGASNFEQEVRRLSIIRETTAELLRQAQAWLALAQAEAAAGKEGASDEVDRAQTAVNQIKQNTTEIQSNLERVGNTALDAGFAGFTTFLNDIVSQSKTAGDAILGFVGSFVSAVQQMIVQLIALAAFKAILGLFTGGASTAAGSAGGGAGAAIRGLAGGGSFDLDRYATDGAFQVRPNGLLSGPGGPKDDEILALVSPREYIFNAEATDSIGVTMLDQINRARGNAGKFISGRADGGSFGSIASAPGIGGIATAQPADNNLHLTSVNMISKGDIQNEVSELMSSSRGQKIIVNAISINPNKVKSILNIG